METAREVFKHWAWLLGQHEGLYAGELAQRISEQYDLSNPRTAADVAALRAYPRLRGLRCHSSLCLTIAEVE